MCNSWAAGTRHIERDTKIKDVQTLKVDERCLGEVKVKVEVEVEVEVKVEVEVEVTH